MSERQIVTIDGNEAAAYVAHKTNEVIAIYPITPSSNMGEWADAWSAENRKNIWGTVPLVVEMQSEGGAAGAVHGALQTGSLTTTFTASQGLLLMIPNMFKIAGELTSTVFHIAARALAAHALSIFGDHSDVMACRSTGWAMLCSNSPQEVMDLALISQAATLGSRVPFLHFFDGFRTSHEIRKIEELADADIRAMIDDNLVLAHRQRALNPEHPFIRGTAQNPDVYFQAREACNSYYLAVPEIVQAEMDKFAGIVGRQYKLFDYVGAPDAERVIVLMGSSADIAHEAVNALTAAGEKVGIVKVRLYRPFSVEHLMAAIPATAKIVTALDRCKEPGGAGEPLYQDIITAVVETGRGLRVLGGRYGLASKEFTAAMVKGVFDNMAAATPKNHFTVGINDDVTHTSIAYDPTFSVESKRGVRAMFYGLGADGTVGANHNSIRIIGAETDNYAQGYFSYDSKKSGTITTSHLRFGPDPIRLSNLIESANFVACHQWTFLERVNVLAKAETGATFLLASPFGPDEVWDQLPRQVQAQIIAKKLRFYVIDAIGVAKATGMGGRINTIMQTCFFAISGVLPRDEAIEKIKEVDPPHLRPPRRGGGAAKLRSRGSYPVAPVRGQVPRSGHQQDQHGIARARPGAGVPQRCDRADHRRQRRQPARLGLPGGRHLALGHDAVGKAQPGAGNPGLGLGDLHPVRQVRAGVPARGHPHQGLSAGKPDRRARDVQGGGLQEPRSARHEVHRPGGARKTAPAVRCAWMPARPRTRASPSSRRSTWSRNRRSASPSATTSSSSWICRNWIAR